MLWKHSEGEGKGQSKESALTELSEFGRKGRGWGGYK